MSSETSIDQRPAEAGHYEPKRDSAEADALQPWQLFTLAGLIGATIVVFLSRGQSPAGIILLSCAIFSAAYVGLMALRTFLPLTGKLGENTTEILGGRTRAALEREKALVLRTIKELEFDRGMGKVSERDFAEMSARLRSRAARLMHQLDAGSIYREQIEREITRRLGAAPPMGEPPATAPPRPSDAATSLVCSACSARNDRDARFCKSCGSRLEVTS